MRALWEEIIVLSITGVRVRLHCVLSVLFLLEFKKSTIWLCDCAVTVMGDAVTDGGVDSSSAVIFDHCPSVPQYFLHLNDCISQSYEVYHYSALSSMELNTPV